MRCQQTERLVEGMRGKGGARGARLLAPDLLAVALEDRFGVIAQKRDFLLVEAVREKQIAEFVELFELYGAKRHDATPFLARFRDCGWIALNLAQSGRVFYKQGSTCRCSKQVFYVPRNLGLRLA